MSAIDSAKAAGIITDMDAGAVETVLRLAERMEDPDFPMIDGRFDNVTESLYFKVCDSLGLTPAGRQKLDIKEVKKVGKLAQLRAVNGGAGGKRAG